MQGDSVRIVLLVMVVHLVRWTRSDSSIQYSPHLSDHMFIRLPCLPLSHSHTGRVYIFPPQPLPVLHLALDEATGA